GFMREKQSVCNIKEALPAIIVAIDDDVHGDPAINLKVLLDGQGDIWAVDAKQGDEVGQWNFYPTEESEFIDEINRLITKLAQQKNDLIELLDGVQEDIENSKIILTEIQKAKAEIEVASVTDNPVTASITNNTETFEGAPIKERESATGKEANAKKV
ncbi:MAG TPA: hypothetical protein VGK38_10495, partial [Prolixibacteraceae bacterium]